VIEASVTIEVAARSGKALTRKAASESPTRAGKLTPAKSAAYTTATKSAAHMSAAESTAHTSATESAANVSATEPAAHMTATESTAHMTATESTAVSTTATVSAATSATRKRVGGQSPGESGSDSEDDHALAQHWTYSFGRDCVGRRMLRRSESVAKEFKRSAVGRREPTTPFRQYGRALSWGSGSLTRRLDAAVGRSGSCQNRNHHKLQDVRVAISRRSPHRRGRAA
jgi:hypothetical protein